MTLLRQALFSAIAATVLLLRIRDGLASIVVLNVKVNSSWSLVSRELNICAVKLPTVNDNDKGTDSIEIDLISLEPYDGCTVYTPGSTNSTSLVVLSKSAIFLRLGSPLACNICTVVHNVGAFAPKLAIIGSDISPLQQPQQHQSQHNPCASNPCRAPLSLCTPLNAASYECTLLAGVACGPDDNSVACSNRSSSRNSTVSMQPQHRILNKVNQTQRLVLSTQSQQRQPEAITPHEEADEDAVLLSTTSASTANVANVTTVRTTPASTSNAPLDVFLTEQLATVNSGPCGSRASGERLCRAQPHGNESFVCVRTLANQDYTLCLATQSIECASANPCLNGGVCLDNNDDDENEQHADDTEKKKKKKRRNMSSSSRRPWTCLCAAGFTGRLCESEVCLPAHRLFANHTMCVADSNSLIRGGLSETDADLILDVHNTLRRQVAPIAANMQKMYWDVRLHHLAQKRAQLCSVDNTGILLRQEPGYGVVIGENLAAGYSKWMDVLTSWMSESRHFIYKSTSPTDNMQAGHYTQMIYSSASRIGCGFAECSNTTYDRYFVCYYGEMQTYYSRYEPYQDGKTCGQCPHRCDSGLCDCAGVYCANGGTLNLNTCTCTCPYATFTGRHCENVVCPREDSQFCSQTLFEDKCWLYPVVRATCPYMCSLCTKSDASNTDASFNSTIVADSARIAQLGEQIAAIEPKTITDFINNVLKSNNI